MIFVQSRAQAEQERQRAEGAVADATKERDRADAAWGRVEDLISQMTGRNEVDPEGTKADPS